MANPLPGLLGTLVSPSRGLLIFSSWVCLALLAPLGARADESRPAGFWGALMLGLAAHAVLFSFYSVWWAGHSFGPRFWTEAMPLFALLLALVRERRPRLWGPALVTVVLSTAIQGVGAFYYPSTWNNGPPSVDHAHERLWNWSDSELSRCFEDGPRDLIY